MIKHQDIHFSIMGTCPRCEEPLFKEVYLDTATNITLEITCCDCGAKWEVDLKINIDKMQV